jgi:hypothetical protein
LAKCRRRHQDYRAQKQIGSHAASTELTSGAFECSLLASVESREHTRDPRRFTVLAVKPRQFARGSSRCQVKTDAHNLQSIGVALAGAPGVPARPSRI